MSMHADEKSDEGIRPMKQPNKEGSPSAEAVEGRTSPEGNGGKTTAARTLRRDTASNGLVAVRRAARQSKNVKPPTRPHVWKHRRRGTETSAQARQEQVTA